MKTLFRLTIYTVFIALTSLSTAFAEANIVTSIKPVHMLVQSVLGETGKATLLIPGHISPHHFAMKPSHMKQIHQADIIFYIDDHFETSLINAIYTASNTTITVSLMDNENLTLYPMKGKHSHHPDEHDENEEGEHHDKPAGNTIDPHVWLSPDNAISMLQQIETVLSSYDPKQKETYRHNTQQAIEKISQINERISQRLKHLKQAAFAVFHNAYQYFERHYHLHNVGAITLNPSLSSSVKHLQSIRQTLKKSGARCVFSEPQFSDRLINTVTEGLEIQIATLDPLGATLPDNASYPMLLAALTDHMLACLDP